MTSSLQKGIEAAKAGLMDEALAQLKDAIIEEPENANVWVWLSAIIEDEDKQVIFLKKALEIDPENRPAQRGLAYIQRKKYIPPRPGESLSDHTKPIGLFRNIPSDTSGKHSAPSLQKESLPPETPANIPDAQSTAIASASTGSGAKVKAKSSHAWLDILLYSIILLVFTMIGILVGSTMLNIPLPFLTEPTPILQVLPPEEGVYLLIDENYQAMKVYLGAPEFEEGIPATDQTLIKLVVNTPLITMETMKIKFENGESVIFRAQKVDDALFTLTPETALQPGLYCVIHELNQAKEEALYWCFRIE